MMQADQNVSLTGFKQIEFALVGCLERLRGFAGELGLGEDVRMVDDAIHRLCEKHFTVVVMGEFKRGKSTFINALLGQEVLPADIEPTTATVNRVTYGPTPTVQIHFKDGECRGIGIDELAAFVTKLSDDAAARAATIREAVVCYPIELCKDHVDIVDTPGLCDDAAMTAVTLAALPTADAVIMVISALAPLSETERTFIAQHLLHSADLGSILFVVSHIDDLDTPEAADRILKLVETRINTYLLDALRRTYPEDSPEFVAAWQKIGTPRIYGLSARDYLKGRQQNDLARIERSRLRPFMSELERFLTLDRGVIALQSPINKGLTVAANISAALAPHHAQQGQDEQAFQQHCDGAEQQINTLRQQQTARISEGRTQAAAILTEAHAACLALQNELNTTTKAVLAASSKKTDFFNLNHLTASMSATKHQLAETLRGMAVPYNTRIRQQTEQALTNEAQRLNACLDAIAGAIAALTRQFADFGIPTTEGSPPVHLPAGTPTLPTITIDESIDVSFLAKSWGGSLISALSGTPTAKPLVWKPLDAFYTELTGYVNAEVERMVAHAEQEAQRLLNEAQTRVAEYRGSHRVQQATALNLLQRIDTGLQESIRQLQELAAQLRLPGA